KNDQLIQKERFGWGDPKHDQSHLTAHVIEDENGQLISYQKYEYDTFGNRTRLSLYGNLTGETKGNISIGKDFAIPSKDSCDALHIVSRYDNRNRKIAEDDGRILNEYTYVGNSDLVAAHYISYEGRIQKRHFYRYDPSRAVSQEIIDDSSSLEASNLANVSQRFIKEIKNSSTGIPEIAEEYAFDIPLNKKILIRKTVDVYDSHGWIISRSIYGSDDLLSHTLEWQYDSHGNVIYYKNALGDVKISQYDANDNLIYEKMPDIAPRFMTYDCMNRLISEEERDPNGESLFKTYAYDVMGNQTSFTDIYGNTTFYDYDEHERLIRVRLPPMKNGTCPTIAYTRNALDLPSSIKDPNGHVTLIEYNLRGMPICTTYPDGTTERCEYTVWDELKRSIGPDGTEIRYTYDPQGRETKQEWFDVKGNLLRFTTKTYNAFHLISETDANGIETSYTYDSAGRLIAKKTDQRVTKYAYDAMGRQTTVSKYLENGSYISDEKRYDTANRVIEQYTLDSHGKIYQREIKHYNGQGNEIQCLRWNQAGKAVTTIDYDLFRREVRSTDPLGNSTYTAYHVEGRARKEVTNPLGVKEVTTYDPLSRPILEQRFDSFGKLVKEVSYEYDPNGNQILTSVTTQKRPIETRWQYDEMNRLTTIIDAAGTQKQRTLQHAYDAAGRLITLTKNDGTTLHYTYDPLGRLIQLKSSDGTVFYKYRYDKNDQLLTARDKVNKTSFTRQYDIYDQMIEEAFPHGNVMRYSYDLIGRTKQLILPDQTSISYHYKGHTLASINRKGALSYQHNYTAYDSSCNPTRMQLAGQAGLLSIDYDLLNRPIKMNVRDWKETLEYHAHLLKKRMTHDSFGEADSTYTYDACDQLLSEKGNAEHTFKYDWQGNPIAHNGNKRQFDSFNALMKDGSRQYTYDQNGNRTCDGVNTYRYDALNRLIEVKTPKTAVRYIYDALDRRIAKIEGKKKTRYLWQNQQEIGTISSKGKIRELKVLAPLNRPVAFELQGAVYAPLTDTFGNVRALLDSSGKPFATYRYSAFGEEQQRGEAISPWRYAGKRADPETALVYFGKRYYDPKTLCWLTPDPLHHADGPNLYTYVHNNPLRYIDPNGLFAIAVPVILEVFTITWGSIEAAIASWVTIETVAATAVTVAAGAAVAHGINSIDATQDVKSDENQDISKKAKKKRNGNPFDGPVDEDVMLIDSAGNAIPIKSGQKAAGSRDGNWIQVEDSKGLPTGLRKDGPHNPNRHKDPRALKPHAHVPEINNLDGTPWLPIKY
ncbi:MAG: RHS repeat domain-containing protein, partial [Parachlamydiaceae bacterium]